LTTNRRCYTTLYHIQNGNCHDNESPIHIERLQHDVHDAHPRCTHGLIIWNFWSLKPWV